LILQKNDVRAIVDSAKDMHTWRSSYNGSRIGRGKDHFEPTKDYDYAEAYALWGRGYVKLHRFAKDERFLDLAVRCGKWLIDNKNGGYDNHSWGLPWAWDKNKAPMSLSYLITTVFVGHLFIDLFKSTKDPEYLKICRSIARWCLSENGFVEDGDGLYFLYANHPSFGFPIYNVTSMASAFFSRLGSETSDSSYRRICEKSASFVISRQNGDGSWNYSEEWSFIDNPHTGFTLEGLCTVLRNLGDTEMGLLPAIIKGAGFYRNKMYLSDGYGFRMLRDKSWMKTKRKAFQNGLVRYLYAHGLEKPFHMFDPETLLWGYASGIRAFVQISGILHQSGMEETLFKFAVRNLRRPDGAFRLRSSEDRIYIRHQAHMFDALCALLLHKLGEGSALSESLVLADDWD